MGRPTGPMGGSYDLRGNGPMPPRGGPLMGGGGPSFPPRGGPGVGPPPNAPFGPSSVRVNDRGPTWAAGHGGFDSRGRPVSGLPSSGRGGAYSRGSDYGGRLSSSAASSTYDAPKGPRLPTTRPTSGRDAREPRKERKWGKDAPPSREDVKRTLTDFRISGLAIPELDWSWKTEAVQAVVKAIVDTAAEDAKEESTPALPVVGQTPVPDVEAPAPADPAPLPPPPPPAPESPEKSVADMSVDEINPADLPEPDEGSSEVKPDVKPDVAELASDVSPEPKNKLSKKEKNKQVAAKRAATLAKSKAAQQGAAAAKGEVDGGEQPAPGAQPKVDASVEAKEGEEVVKEEIEDESSSAVPTTRKDAKHGRDDESLVITDVTAKKVKADTGEIVRLESVGVEMEVAGGVQGVKVEEEVARPPTPTGPKALSIPTGPAADTGRAPSAPANRENSRLRIYFASPVSSVSTYSAPLQSDRSRSVKENTEPPASANGDDEARQTNGSLAQPSSGVDVVKEEEDVDGVEVEDVDGDAAPGNEGTAHAEQGTILTGGDSDDDSDDVESTLLDIKPRTEEDAESEPSSTGAPVITGDNSAYPPVPYPQASSANGDAGISESHANSELPVLNELLPPEPSADRISISYARNTRRMVLDAEVVDKVTIFRAEGRIELSVAIHPATLGNANEAALDEFRICRGILVSPSFVQRLELYNF